jgi:hypothetical protein
MGDNGDSDSPQELDSDTPMVINCSDPDCPLNGGAHRH